MKRMVLIAFFSASIFFAQQVYKVPFASQNNSIELVVENKYNQKLLDVQIVFDAPEWVLCKHFTYTVPELNSGSEVASDFMFDIDKLAPINEQAVIKFMIKSDKGMWNKEIAISVSPPQEFLVEQNYPNPFNPVTTLEYQLPEKSKVDVSIYNMLGQLVEQLQSGIKEPGLHKVEWNASGYASGVYIYQVYAQGKEDRVIRKKMLLVK